MSAFVSRATVSCGGLSPETVSPSMKSKKPPITIKVHVFFDGTLNNYYNTREREHFQSRSDVKCSGAELPEKYKDNSYANDLSNIAHLFQVAPNQVLNSSTLRYESIYVEGIGTSKYDTDSRLGYGVGKGPTGIEKRVEEALDNLYDKIKVKEVAVERDILVQVFVFGFSRGSAAARHFIYQLLEGTDPICLQTRLQFRGHPSVSVLVKFAGLFDTVSSVGWFGNFSNDVKELHLDAVKRAEQVVHLIAADEYRKNYACTRANSSQNLTEIFLPGAHSDVGGSYVGREHEEDICVFKLLPQALPLVVGPMFANGAIFGNDMKKLRIERERNWFIDQGWCKADEIRKVDNTLVVNRWVGNEYSRIPLHIMMKLANLKAGIVFSREAEIAFPISKTLRKMTTCDGRPVLEFFLAYAQLNSSSLEDWKTPRPWLKELRATTLHLSAKYGSTLGADDPQFCIGNKNYGDDYEHVMNGERCREWYSDVEE